MHEQRSEVAYLMTQIRNEYAACQQALHGLALGTAQHAFMNAKTERLAQRVEELRQVAGDEAVRHVLTRLGETLPEEALPVVMTENRTQLQKQVELHLQEM